MAGTPKLEQLYQDIAAAGGFQSIYDAIADGALIREIAGRFGVSRGWFSWAVRKDPARAKCWDEAMAMRADTMAEQAIEIADAAPETSAGVQKAKLRAELRQWLAAVDNGKYRRAQGPSIAISIGEMHLDALRHRNVDSDRLPSAGAEPADTLIESTPLVALPPAPEGSSHG